MKKREFIVQDLLSKIYQEEFKDGKLPNQRKLAEIYHVSRFTIQQAIKNLEEIGIVRVVQGSGIFIHEKWVKNPLIFNSLTRNPYDRIHSKMISLNKAPATADEQKIFQLDDGAEVWTFERIRIVDYKIEQLEMSKMPVACFPTYPKKSSNIPYKSTWNKKAIEFLTISRVMTQSRLPKNNQKYCYVNAVHQPCKSRTELY